VKRHIKLTALGAALAALSAPASACDIPGLEYAYLGAATADMLTTLDIKHHANLQEMNALLGTHPSDAKVVAYFAATDALHAAMTCELVNGNVPHALVSAWEYVTIGIETGYAVHNYSIGLRFSF